MEINYFYFDGKCSRDFETYISGSQTYNLPERDVSMLSVPGRNGDLVQDNGRWKNFSFGYPAFIYRDFEKNAQGLKSWLAGVRGYKRLEDSYHPDYFRLAAFTGSLEFEMSQLNRAGQFEIRFDCKPQKFLKLGETPIEVTSGSILLNEWFESLPLIRLSGSGESQISIGNKTIKILDTRKNTVIDCDLQNAYAGNINLNNKIELNNYEFPSLLPGENKIVLSGGITKAEIIPRWWTI